MGTKHTHATGTFSQPLLRRKHRHKFVLTLTLSSKDVVALALHFQVVLKRWIILGIDATRMAMTTTLHPIIMDTRCYAITHLRSSATRNSTRHMGVPWSVQWSNIILRLLPLRPDPVVMPRILTSNLSWQPFVRDQQNGHASVLCFHHNHPTQRVVLALRSRTTWLEAFATETVEPPQTSKQKRSKHQKDYTFWRKKKKNIF